MEEGGKGGGQFALIRLLIRWEVSEMVKESYTCVCVCVLALCVYTHSTCIPYSRKYWWEFYLAVLRKNEAKLILAVFYLAVAE